MDTEWEIYHLFFGFCFCVFFQYEEYQGQMDHSIKRMTKNLQRIRTFWANGLNSAKQNQMESGKANNIAPLPPRQINHKI